jgi:rod shape-determining protein MreC
VAAPYTRRRALLLLVLTCILLITLDQRDSGVISNVREGFSYIFRPFEGVTRAVTRPVRNAWRGITNYDELERENLYLRDQLARQAGNSAAAEAFVREHYELRTLEQLPTPPEIEHVLAQVIGGSPRDDQQTVEINQGSRRGIRIGMPVVNGAGLIGKVTEVFPDGAVVRLITDPEYALAVKITCSAKVPGTVEDPDSTTPSGIPIGGSDPRFAPVETTTTTTPFFDPLFADPFADTTTTTAPEDEGGDTTTSSVFGPDDTAIETTIDETAIIPAPCDRETGSIRGRGKGQLPVVALLNDDVRNRAIEVGDRVISAGGAESLAPQDLPIGRVVKVTERKGASPEVEIEPNADLSRLNFVRVLLYVPASEVSP